MGTEKPASTTFGRISSDKVREETGRGWDEWLQVLDGAGGADWDHKTLVSYLEREHPEVNPWWRQSVTVGYEQARGKRVMGQTADAGFQVGVQRSVALTVMEAWELIISRPELWLGDGASVVFEPGAHYEVPPRDDGTGVSGEIRVVKPGDRLRMTWQPEGSEAPATLQLTLLDSGSGKTAINVHVEKLADAHAREAMRTRWRAALERIADAAS